MTSDGDAVSLSASMVSIVERSSMLFKLVVDRSIDSQRRSYDGEELLRQCFDNTLLNGERERTSR